MKTASRPRRDHTGCPCGCAECPEPGCELECQVRPRFFCGQLLTDEDLTGLVDWTAAKLRLQRYRDGWGVVCGLDVRADPDNPRGVVVRPGYAISCCGDDIVVCEPQPVDLSGECRDETSCEEPGSHEPVGGDDDREPRPGKEGHDERDPIDDLVDRLDEAEGEDRSTGSARVVDLVVTYEEEHTESRPTLRTSECGHAAECEAAKTREGFRIRPRPPSDPVAEAVERFCRDYQRCLDVLRAFRREFGDNFAGKDGRVRDWLLRWLADHPPQHHPWLRSTVRTSAPESVGERAVAYLLLLVLDCRQTWAIAGCHACEASTGVPLARITLGPAGAECGVENIDPFPPHRRELQPHRWPAPPGTVNLAGLLGARWEEACRRLADLGVGADRVPVRTDSVRQLAWDLDCGCDPIVACGTRVRVLVTRVLGAERVVGFCRETPDDVEDDEERPREPEYEEPAREPEYEEPAREPEYEEPAREPEYEEPPGDVAHEDTDIREAEGVDPSEERRLLLGIRGVGETLADRLLQAGFTIRRLARARVEEVAPMLPQPSRGRAADIIDAAAGLAAERSGREEPR